MSHRPGFVTAVTLASVAVSARPRRNGRTPPRTAHGLHACPRRAGRSGSGPIAFWVAVGTLVIMGVWTITTATYFAFRDDVLT